MRSAHVEEFWQAFRDHEGLSHGHHEVTHFMTPPDVADRLIELMLAGVMRATVAPIHILGEGRDEPVPEVGDYDVLVDAHRRPRLIWRTTAVTVAPLASVTDEFIWRSGRGTGERDDWLTLLGGDFDRLARTYGFEMHADIETVFETVEVVWPYDVAWRVRLVTTQLDRGMALLGRLNEHQCKVGSLEAIFAQIRTAVLTVGHTMVPGFTNPAADALLRRADGLLVRNGRLVARCHADEQELATTVFAACPAQTNGSGTLSGRIRKPTAGELVSICRDREQPPYRVSIFPLRRDHTKRALASKAEAVLFVHNPDDDINPGPIGLCSRAFRLTPAEARLAVHLASGASLTKAAEAFGITHNTARAQLRAIFDKTETHRQADLVRLLHTTQNLRIALS